MISKDQNLKWQLRDLVNLAVQIRRDGSKSAAELQSRDERIGLEIYSRSNDPVPSRSRVILLWVRRLFQSESYFGDQANTETQKSQTANQDYYSGQDPGQRVIGAYKLIGVGLAAVGLGVGWSVSSVLLAYTGSTPINVLNFIGTVVVGQLLILPFTLVTLTKDLNLNLKPYFGPIIHLAKYFLYKVAKVRGLTDNLTIEAQSALSFHRLYRRVELWLVLLLLQIFALSFNSGILLSAFYLVATTDLAFSWATTLDLGATQVGRLVDFLALPWSLFWPAAVPSVDLIEATQYVRLDGSYLSKHDSQTLSRHITTGWWPFLIASTLFYGLLPRLLLGCWILWRLNRYLKNFTCNTVDGHNIYQRLMRNLPNWRTDLHPLGELKPLSSPSRSEARSETSIEKSQTVEMRTGDRVQRAKLNSICHDTVALAVVLWRDLPVSPDQARDYLESLRIKGGEQIFKAGGSSGDLEALSSAKLTLAKQSDHNMKGGCVIVLVESFEAPGKAIKRFVTELGGHLAKYEITIFIEPITLTDDTMRRADFSRHKLWGRHITEWANPWIGMIERGGVT